MYHTFVFFSKLCFLFDLVLLARKIFDEDNYTPMLCKDESECSYILKEFPFENSDKLQVLWLL